MHIAAERPIRAGCVLVLLDTRAPNRIVWFSMSTQQLCSTHLLSYRRIFWFWIPLAAMWFMMAVEQPMIAAAIARMRDPENNLAAYGVVYAVALIIESPIIMLLTAGTALSRGAISYRRLLRFANVLIGGLTAIHLFIGITPLFDLIVRRVIGAPEQIAVLCRAPFLAITPWSAAVGYRRLWQGVLIRYDRTGVVPVTIAVRLVVTAALLAAGFAVHRYSGVLIGSVALAMGIITAAVTAYLFARPVIRRHLSESDGETDPLGQRELIAFYLPLALTSLILLAARPLLTVALTRLPNPVQSLAVWPVLLSVSFLGRSIAMSFQEVGIALNQDAAAFAMLRRFAWVLASVMLVLFCGFALTPLAGTWFRRVAGLSPELTRMTRVPMMVIAALPALGSLISWQRAFLVTARRTAAITRSVLVNLAVLGIVIVVLGVTAHLPGLLIASVAYISAVSAESIFLFFTSAKIRRVGAVIRA